MADASFDAVIVGGGNKALILSMYLTKYGNMEVGIFEDRNELGMGWSQEETAPGFIGYNCSMDHSGMYHIPVYQDFPEWETYGARYAYTKVSTGCAFKEDDSCVLQYTAYEDVDPDQEMTAESIARFSRKDADTYLRLWGKYKKYWEPAFLEHFFNPAKPIGEPDAIDKLLANPDSGIDPLWLYMTGIQLFKDLFEDPHTRHAFARATQSLGLQLDQVGQSFAVLYIIMFYFPCSCWAVGGSHVLTHASHKVIFENGGKTFTNCPVDKILIKDGRAGGIKLEDGTEIEARKFVVSTVDPHQLCFNLIGKEYLSDKISRRVENIERDWGCIMWYTWALKERPVYKAEAWNPDVWQCQWLPLGDMDLDTFLVEGAERRLGKWPSKFNIGTAYHGISEVSPGDSLLAPKDINFVIQTEQYVLPAWRLSESEWKEKEKRHAEEVIEEWHKYAPNMSWDNVTGYLASTPYYCSKTCRNFGPAGNMGVIDNSPAQWGKLRPIPELASHRIPGIAGLYATGAGWHPWASAHSAQGYNCYKVIADDFNLKKPWEKEGRPF